MKNKELGYELGEKIELCDDAVSREDAYKIVMMPDTPYGKHKGTLIRELPPVTPQQKYGKWITTRTFMHDGEYYCDRCKCEAPNNEKWDYCPNCGRRMVESQKSEEGYDRKGNTI